MGKKMRFGIILVMIMALFMPNVSAEENTKSNWELLTEKTQNDVKSEFSNAKFNVTDKKMEITIPKEDGKDSTNITFTYANGIVSFTSALNVADSSKLDEVTVESTVINKLLENVAEIFDYDHDSYVTWFENLDASKVTVANDGIEYTVKKYTSTSDSGSFSGEHISSLKVNVEIGISSYLSYATGITPPCGEPEDPEPIPEQKPEPTPTPEPQPEPTPVQPEKPVVQVETETTIDTTVNTETSVKTETVETTVVEQKVENPVTGIKVSFIIATITALVVTGVYVVMKNKNYFSKI